MDRHVETGTWSWKILHLDQWSWLTKGSKTAWMERDEISERPWCGSSTMVNRKMWRYRLRDLHLWRQFGQSLGAVLLWTGKNKRLLRQAIWPKAFYGVSICTIGWGHIKTLRTEAMKALGFQMAGASPGLRLGLLCHEQCDPGFFQVWQVLTTFRRMVKKRPLFEQMWKDYMDHFDGTTRQGPFAKMLEVCQQLRWTIEVPKIADADGCWHDWISMNEKVLYELAKDAWTWKVFREVQQRKDLEGLHGIDRRIMQQAHSRVRPHSLGSILRLQDGTFIEPTQHAKYDLSKSAQCVGWWFNGTSLHRMPATPTSVHEAPWHSAEVGYVFQVLSGFICCLRAMPYWPRFKQMVAIKEDLWRRTCALPEPELCHLFTDGSCHGGRHRLYQLAAWAVVSATSDSCIASGALGGLGQDIDRAELRATIAAVQYAVDIQRDTVVWTDSTFAAEGLVRLLRDGDDLPGGHCAEDWIELQGLLCQCDVQIWVHHVPGHAHWVNQDADVDNWAARWNDRADREANMAMKMHGGELLRLHQQLWEPSWRRTFRCMRPTSTSLGHHRETATDSTGWWSPWYGRGWRPIWPAGWAWLPRKSFSFNWPSQSGRCPLGDDSGIFWTETLWWTLSRWLRAGKMKTLRLSASFPSWRSQFF